jgi:uncharacterized membrane protein YfcA
MQRSKTHSGADHQPDIKHSLTPLLIALLFFAAALLYASVGNAGATSYLAVMAFFGFPPGEMKPTALVLNIVVAAVAAYKFYRAGYFSWRIFWPFAIASIPFAYLGGGILLPASIYKPMIGLALFYVAYRLFRMPPANGNPGQIQIAPLWASLAIGAGMGFLAGLTGIGGGILLSPLLLLVGWADARQAAAAAAVFNLVNSFAGLAGHLAIISSLPAALPVWALTAGLGGWIGAEYGSRKLATQRLQQILAIILIIAAIRIGVP